MRCRILLFFIINFPLHTSVYFAQPAYSLQDTIQAIKYFEIGDSLLKFARFDSSLFYFQKAKEIYGQINNGSPYFTEKKLQCDNKTAWTLMRQDRLDTALSLITRCLGEAVSVLGEDNAEVAQSYHVTGVIHWAGREYFKALDYHRKALQIRLRLFGENNSQVASSYNNIGIIYQETGHFDKALEYYEKTLAADLNSSELNEESLAKTYNNIGNVYNEKGDNDKGLEYHKRSLSIRLRILGEENPYTAHSYSNIGIGYAKKGEYLKALDYFYKSSGINRRSLGEFHRSAGNDYNNIANCYYYTGDYDMALEYCLKSLDVKVKSLGESNPVLLTGYVLLGNIYKGKGDFILAEESVRKAISIGVTSLGRKHYDVAYAYLNLAEIYKLKKDYNTALKFCQEALIALVFPFNDKSVYTNPPLDDFNSEDELLNALSLKAELFNRLAKTTGLRDLRMSLSTYQLTAELIDKIRFGYKSETSKLSLGEKASEVYQRAIITSLDLYNITKDENYKYLAFMFTEKSKAAVLHEGLAELQAKQFAGIPAELLDEEKELKTSLAFYDTHLQKEYLKTSGKDSLKISAYEDQLFDLRKKYEELLSSFEKDYPDYHALKYHSQVLPVSEIRKHIPANTSLVEYFTGDSLINIFILSADQFDVITVNKPGNLNALVREFCSSIIKSEKKKYIESGNELSSLLVETILPRIKSKLVIIPHDILYKVPFEALFTKNENAGTDFSSLNYLITDLEISYYYSSTLYINGLKKSRKYSQVIEPGKTFIGFAPVFADNDPMGYTVVPASLTEEDEIMRSVTADGRRLNELKYSEWEIKSIMELFSGTIKNPGLAFFYSDATEENFKAYINRFNIIHIATHSFINDSHPALSGIVFAQTGNGRSNDDGILYPGEIYNLELDADLVILSSCESGLGKMIKGEGMMALTRGFLYSGASNIIFSLWKIPDKHTSQLMVNFYKSVLSHRGKSYSASLREAKLSLIKNPSTAHPRSWASFLLVGSK